MRKPVAGKCEHVREMAPVLLRSALHPLSVRMHFVVIVIQRRHAARSLLLRWVDFLKNKVFYHGVWRRELIGDTGWKYLLEGLDVLICEGGAVWAA